MFQNPSLLTRIAVGKLTGLLFGATAFYFIPQFDPTATMSLQFGVFFWYITLGAIVGMMGVLDRYPLLNLRMPALFRGIWIGGWMNFMLGLFVPETMQKMIEAVSNGALSSHHWFILEGAVIGLIMDLLATRYGGEGLAAVKGYQKEQLT